MHSHTYFMNLLWDEIEKKELRLLGKKSRSTVARRENFLSSSPLPFSVGEWIIYAMSLYDIYRQNQTPDGENFKFRWTLDEARDKARINPLGKLIFIKNEERRKRNSESSIKHLSNWSMSRGGERGKTLNLNERLFASFPLAKMEISSLITSWQLTLDWLSSPRFELSSEKVTLERRKTI